MKQTAAKLALEDGTVYSGRGFGAEGTTAGEVVFNTGMTGYQEVLTDPSYAGQIVTMTYPLIGNYGVCDEDAESSGPQVDGFIVKELARRHSNFRAGQSLGAYLAHHGIIGISGVDTRAITRKLRVGGALKGVLSTEIRDDGELVRMAVDSPSLVGRDLVERVAPPEPVAWDRGFESAFAMRPTGVEPRFDVVAIDCGIKRNIPRNLVEAGCRVTLVPASTPAEAILEREPDGLFVSNGPGDPEPLTYAIESLRKLSGRLPIFGICLGHQLLGLSLGATTYKLKFGHRGVNQPVRNLATGRVEITSQNHGFAVETASLEKVGGVPTHVNLNDETLEGFRHKDLPIFSVQYHPEASPGPHDATYLFDCFMDMMSTGRAPTAEQMADAQQRLESRR